MTDATAEEQRDALVERLLGATIGAFELAGVYLGERLGLYRALAEGARTAGEVAQAAGIAERYAVEWLEQQAAGGILEASQVDGEWRFSLPLGHEEVLLDAHSLYYAAPFARLLVACLRPVEDLMNAFRSGDGVPYASYGTDLHEGQGAFTRPMFLGLLAQEWLPALPAVHERLLADPPALVADVACGVGWSSIGIALGYPSVRVDGIDLDDASIARARANLVGTGVEERVAFEVRDASDPRLAGRYDLVTIFESLHDMSYPVDVLRACRMLLAEGGVVLVGDERTEDAFSPNASDLERFYYGFSILHCLPVGMVGEGAAGTGTVMRASTVERYAREADFGSVEIASIEHDFWRFYVLRG